MPGVAIRTEGLHAITFLFRCNACSLTLNRDAREALETTLRQLSLECAKDHVPAPESSILVSLEGPNGSLPLTMPLQDAIKQAVTLVVGGVPYTVSVNLPTLLSVCLPTGLIATCPATPTVFYENMQITECTFEWRFLGDHSMLGDTATFTPPVETSGKELQLLVSHPKCASVVTTCTILCWREDDTYNLDRLKSFTNRSDLRVMSFNLLAPMYLHREGYTDQVYPYCTAPHLAWEYRFQLLSKEILAIDADLACLQEVQVSKYSDFHTLFPRDEFLLYFWPKRSSGDGEGCALAIRKSSFELVTRQDIAINEELLQHGVMGQEWMRCSWASVVKEVLANLGTVAQICVVRDRKSDLLWAVSNTHLFYHPSAEHIRVLQVAKLIEILSAICEKTGAIPIIAGDFNAMPGSACMRLLEGVICADDVCWSKCDEYKWKYQDSTHVDVYTNDVEDSAMGDAREVDGLHLQHGLNLTHCFPNLEWTNLDHGFVGLLDHIFVGPGVKPHQSLSVPDMATMKDQYGGIPNRCYGSDHMAVAVDLCINHTCRT